MKNRIRYTCQGYRYAPESFKCYMVVINPNGNNHSYYELDNFTGDENNKIGTIYISKGKELAEAEIKKIVRSKNKKQFYNSITYGFRLLNSNSVAYLDHKEIDNDANILDKLKLYKDVIETFKKDNYIVTEYKYSGCELDANYKPINKFKSEIKQELNPTPLKIRYVKSIKEKSLEIESELEKDITD